MSIRTAILTDEEARVVRDNEPTFSDRQGVDLPAKLNEFAAEVAAEVGGLISGVGTVPNGTAQVIIADPALAGLDGSPCWAVLAEPDGTLAVGSCQWNGDDTFDINTTGNVTADRDVFWFVDGR